MYNLIVTELRYPKNLTSVYEYSNYKNLSDALEYMINNNLISKKTILRIEKKGGGINDLSTKNR